MTRNTDPNPLRYCGEYLDDETGLIYLRARYYDSKTGRFISEDPARDGANWFAYCDNNPIERIDPSGKTYIIAWSYGTKDVAAFEEWLNANSYNVVADGDTSDWGNAEWNEFNQRSSFARAAYTQKNDLINEGVAEEDIIVQRVGDVTELEAAWSEWMEIETVDQLYLLTHGARSGPTTYKSDAGDFLLNAPALNYVPLPWFLQSGDMLAPMGKQYKGVIAAGCNTGGGEWAQKFANSQNTTVYAQTYYASFSESPLFSMPRIQTHRKEANVYYRSYELLTWLTEMKLFGGNKTGAANGDDLGKAFRPR